MGCLKLTNYKQKLPRRWTSTVKFFYKDYTLIEESTASNEVLKEFVWDPTAGQATKPLYMRVPQTGSNLLYLHDANKNVTEVSYLATANGIGAHYEYDVFGNIIVNQNYTMIGLQKLSDYNPFRFSSEYHDDELDLIYYNYRHYNPQSGRWINRDPIEEIGGNNLYNFVKNNSSNYIDVLGLTYKKYTGEATANWTVIVDGVSPTTGMVTQNVQQSWMKFKYSLDVTCSCILINNQEIWTPSVSISISDDFELDWYSRLHEKITPSISVGALAGGYDIEYVTEVDYLSIKIDNLGQGSFNYSITVKVKEQSIVIAEISIPLTNVQIGGRMVIAEELKSAITISQVISCP